MSATGELERVRHRSGRPPAIGVAFACGALALVSLAGCGSDEEGGGTTSATTTTATETITETAPQDGGGDGAPPPADTEVTELTSFSSPSGNIGCLIDRESVRCDIAERDWEPPPKPDDCDLGYGQGVTLTAGGTADFVCAGDTALNATTSGAPLPYGESIAAGLLRCESARSGITCRDVETGRGFAIAREGYELF